MRDGCNVGVDLRIAKGKGLRFGERGVQRKLEDARRQDHQGGTADVEMAVHSPQMLGLSSAVWVRDWGGEG